MIELREITLDNHVQVRLLAVRDDQTHLVASVDRSLADAFVYKEARVKAAYWGEQPVGFTRASL